MSCYDHSHLNFFIGKAMPIYIKHFLADVLNQYVPPSAKPQQWLVSKIPEGTESHNT